MNIIQVNENLSKLSQNTILLFVMQVKFKYKSIEPLQIY